MAPSEDLLHAEDEDTGELTTRILDAALEEFGAYGLRRTTVDNVARRAGLGRATVYRRFGNKLELMRAVSLREARRAMVVMVRAAEHLPTIEDRLVEGFVTGVTQARANRLLTRLISAEPEVILPYLTTDSRFVLTFIRDFLAEQFRRSPGPPAVAAPDAAAEIMVRLAMSFYLAPHGCVPLDTEDDMRAFARTYLVPLLYTGAAPR
ncbi:TetR family transcriptional regulator [Spirillospora sp. NPDC029432]|uniref:TetR/AcrR family transcriptional regulator n=1 Tax=Spirillospora sp. NPDC029432 TaxID=3154599 RepID=UPI0034537F99